MSYSLAALASEYASDWARMTIPTRIAAAAGKTADRIVAHRAEYSAVEGATRVPWFLTGLFHMRESNLDFGTHLHNGDPLDERTTHVPRGRPLAGEPPFDWTVSAIDALRFDELDRVGSWPLEVIAYRAEGYNGFGPRVRGRKSGYLWAGSSIYDGGKFIKDRVWDAHAWDEQLGVMTVLKVMVARGLVTIGAPSITIAPPMTDTEIQHALNVVLARTAGWSPLAEDGSFGRQTRAAVRLFQRQHGLHQDGDPGPLTRAALQDALETASK